MELYNVESKLEKELEATDLIELSVSELRSLAVDVQTEFMNGNLENDILVSDVFMEIIKELTRRVK